MENIRISWFYDGLQSARKGIAVGDVVTLTNNREKLVDAFTEVGFVYNPMMDTMLGRHFVVHEIYGVTIGLPAPCVTEQPVWFFPAVAVHKTVPALAAWEGIVMGLGLEVLLCMIAFFTFKGTFSVMMLTILVAGLGARLLCVVGFKTSVTDWTRGMVVLIFFLLSFVPFIPYSLCLSWALLTECGLTETSIDVRSWTKGTLSTLHFSRIQCPGKGVLPVELYSYAPTICTIGVPLMFYYIFTKAAFGFNIDLQKKQTALITCLLHLLDVMNIAYFPYQEEAFAYFVKNPRNSAALSCLDVVAFSVFLLAVCQVVSSKDHRTLSKEVRGSKVKKKDPSMHCLCLLCMLGIDAPLCLARMYLKWTHSPIPNILLAKNVVCLSYEVSHLLGWSAAISMVESLLFLLPYTDTLTREADKYATTKLATNADDYLRF